MSLFPSWFSETGLSHCWRRRRKRSSPALRHLRCSFPALRCAPRSCVRHPCSGRSSGTQGELH